MGSPELIESLVAPAVEAAGYRLVRLRLLGAKRKTLQVMAERADGQMDVEDCAKLSRHISEILDAADPITDDYDLEVSSPGLDRMLFTPEQYRLYPAAMLKIRINGNVAGRRNFTGILKDVVTAQEGLMHETTIVVQVGSEDFRIPFRQIERASLVLQD